MRVVVLALLLGACAHRQQVFALGDELSVVADGLEVAIRNERPSLVYGLQKGPLFMARPGKNYEKNGCFEGFYNPSEIYLRDSRAGMYVQPFVLCHDPEAPQDPSAFRLGLRAVELHGQVSGRENGVSDAGIKQFQFTVHVVAATSADVHVEGSDTRRLRLPPGADVFREHPEIMGAVVALGILKPGTISLDR